MKKKRWLFVFLALVAGYFIFDELKGKAIDYYADNYYVRVTSYPSAVEPDQVCLTWTGDPRSSQTVQWRTSAEVDDGWIEYRQADAERDPLSIEADLAISEDPLLENDPVNHRFTAELRGLEPGQTYAYRVGSRERDTWSDWRTFTTAPESEDGYSFIYMGDAQVGLRSWGQLLHRAHERHPDARFYVIAGDLVNKGNWRNEWDEFFNGACSVFDQKVVIPSLGNHDYAKQDVPQHYLHSFALPGNGPEGLDDEYAYWFNYDNALFVVLDSNRDIDVQTPWLEETLAGSDATWKFVVYHHPAYSSAPHRDNDDVFDQWTPLFEEYGVDVALQGHDHAYLRTFPMKGGAPVPVADGGVYYTVTVSGTKFYEQENHDYAEIAFPEVSTYQVIDIAKNPDRLTYTAYDLEGTVRDSFAIEK